MAGELIHYDAMCHAIAEAYLVDEVKMIRDKATALEHYARLAQNVEAERQCCEIRLRAERKAGQLLAKMEKAKERAGRGRPGKMSTSSTLSALGVTRHQASDWQQLGRIPEPEFEAALSDPTRMPTTAGIIAAVAERQTSPVGQDALWVWGRVREFHRRGLVEADPGDVLATMTRTMREDLAGELPAVVAFLQRLSVELRHGPIQQDTAA